MSTLDKFSLLMKMNADYLPRNYCDDFTDLSEYAEVEENDDN